MVWSGGHSSRGLGLDVNRVGQKNFVVVGSFFTKVGFQGVTEMMVTGAQESISKINE